MPKPAISPNDLAEVLFRPHPWFRGGHTQTIIGHYLGPNRIVLPSKTEVVPLDDGDRLAVFDSRPERWKPGAPAAVLLHGLAGTADASYLLRLTRRLTTAGVRVVRMNLRGAGAGFGLAKRFYHAGKTEDVRAVVDWTAADAPGSRIAVVGFSLGANLALKLAAEASRASYPGVPIDAVVAANPPIDLSACCRAMQRRGNRIYDWNFVRWLRFEVARLHRLFPDLGPAGLKGVRTVYDFDDRYNAPRNGFLDAEDYYRRSSAGPLIPEITLDGLVVHAQDDPFVPGDLFQDVRFPASVRFELLPTGGHLGYISRDRHGTDRRWLEARLASWLLARWGLASA